MQFSNPSFPDRVLVLNRSLLFVPFTCTCKVVVIFESMKEFLSVNIQLGDIEEYFPMVML